MSGKPKAMVAAAASDLLVGVVQAGADGAQVVHFSAPSSVDGLGEDGHGGM